ncbi:MAG: type II toxin-antitoxin system RelE/ParE family toxin [Thermodesulfobacteriota bacterium]|nr:type II toxin-antitoxin system RelE/ParE family toxin [Thermodesulfobacteriota bacterium]
MNNYTIIFTKKTAKDCGKLTPQNKKKLKEILLNKITHDPHAGKKLIGDLEGFYSVRLNYQDRIVYSIDEETITVCIHRTRTHYGD